MARGIPINKRNKTKMTNNNLKGNNNCKGCYTHMSLDASCPTTLVENADTCPCRICLIKGVCGRACDEYEKFSIMYNKTQFHISNHNALTITNTYNDD